MTRRAAQTTATAETPTEYLAKPVEQETVEVMQYIAPDGERAGNLPVLQAFVGEDLPIEPQPSFNVSTGQTCVHVAGDLASSGDYVVKHADGSVEVLTEDVLNDAYTAK